jgi:hypothetical protein
LFTCVNAHDELNEGGEREQKEDGGEGDVVRKVDSPALVAFELDLK